MTRARLEIGLLATLLWFGAVAAAVPMPSRGLCAHRGDGKSFPENTVPALVSAARKGAAMVEFDVLRCKTGELVVMHDATVDRTTDGTGKVAELTFAEIRALDAGKKKDARFAGVKVPTFDEAIDCLPREGIWINIDCGEGVAADVARAIRDKGRLHQAFVAAPLADIATARAAVPEVLACNMSRTGAWGHPWTREETLAYVTNTANARCQFMQLIAPCEAEDLKLIHQVGGKVNYTMEDTPERARLRFAQGVDFVLTNDLDALRPILNDERETDKGGL